MRRIQKVLIISILTIVSTVVASPANAAQLLLLNYPQVSLAAYGVNASYWGAQKFTAGSTSTLSSIDIPVSVGALTAISFRSDSSSLPGATLTTWSTVTSTPATTPNTQTFTGSFNVTSGTSYWIVFHSTSQVQLYWSGATSQSGSPGWSAPTPRSGAYSTNAGATWTTDTIIQSFSLRINGSSISQVATPNSPVVSQNSGTSINISETSTTANASAYLAKIYSSNGLTLIDSLTISSSNITSNTVFSGLTPNSNYYLSVTAIGDGTSYSNSAESAKVLFFLPRASTTVLITAPLVAEYRSSTLLTATTSKSGSVAFYSNGKRIAGCIKVAVSITTATCNWKPALKGNLEISVVFTPSDLNYLSSGYSLRVASKPRVSSR
ncbi:MAG: hypothetical protein F2602_02950 [Actinobacteria bacterium]|uniref:Unannotated protein n=1 Tax=freshwater metagenome TaxID=449393 RepID=A0A6J6I9W0_9ZZZZ|nr:hypothetical protein [Actinomycetota bacterium]MTA21289.1 hypothetical protein [Actinomycetota bacterium]